MDGVAQALQAADQSTLDGVTFVLVEVGATELTVDVGIAEQVIDDHQERVSDCDRGFVLPPSSRESMVLGREIGIAGSPGGMRGLDQDGAEPEITLACPPSRSLAGAFVIARTHAGPGGEVCGGRKAAHVGAEFGEQRFSGAAPNARDRVQSSKRRLGGLETLRDLSGDLADQVIEGIDVCQLPCKEKALMRSKSPM